MKKIAIFTTSKDAAALLTNVATEHRFNCTVFGCVTEMFNCLWNNDYCGIALDIKSISCLDESERILIQEICNVLPSVKVSVTDLGLRTIGLGYFGGEEAFSAFLEKRCATFKPHNKRGERRRSLHFNAIYCLCRKSESVHCDKCVNTESWTKTFTIDVSSSGLFIHSVKSPEIGALVSLKLVELGGEPILGKIAWRVDWGKTMKISGFGIKIDVISNEQINKINSLII